MKLVKTTTMVLGLILAIVLCSSLGGCGHGARSDGEVKINDGSGDSIQFVSGWNTNPLTTNAKTQVAVRIPGNGQPPVATCQPPTTTPAPVPCQLQTITPPATCQSQPANNQATAASPPSAPQQLVPMLPIQGYDPQQQVYWDPKSGAMFTSSPAVPAVCQPATCPQPQPVITVTNQQPCPQPYPPQAGYQMVTRLPRAEVINANNASGNGIINNACTGAVGESGSGALIGWGASKIKVGGSSSSAAAAAGK